jgi:hypothetical protein
MICFTGLISRHDKSPTSRSSELVRPLRIGQDRRRPARPRPIATAAPPALAGYDDTPTYIFLGSFPSIMRTIDRRVWVMLRTISSVQSSKAVPP